MKKISQNGTYKFSDADVWQESLLLFDEPKDYHMKLYNAFKGRKVTYDSLNDEVTAFALNHTLCVNAKEMLTILEKDDMITAISSDSKRKRGTFNESVNAIDFHGRIENGVLF